MSAAISQNQCAPGAGPSQTITIANHLQMPIAVHIVPAGGTLHPNPVINPGSHFYQCKAKPSDMGSSIGISAVRGQSPHLPYGHPLTLASADIGNVWIDINVTPTGVLFRTGISPPPPSDGGQGGTNQPAYGTSAPFGSAPWIGL